MTPKKMLSNLEAIEAAIRKNQDHPLWMAETILEVRRNMTPGQIVLPTDETVKVAERHGITIFEAPRRWQKEGLPTNTTTLGVKEEALPNLAPGVAAIRNHMDARRLYGTVEKLLDLHDEAIKWLSTQPPQAKVFWNDGGTYGYALLLVFDTPEHATIFKLFTEANR